MKFNILEIKFQYLFGFLIQSFIGVGGEQGDGSGVSKRERENRPRVSRRIPTKFLLWGL